MLVIINFKIILAIVKANGAYAIGLCNGRRLMALAAEISDRVCGQYYTLWQIGQLKTGKNEKSHFLKRWNSFPV
ncbi:hypothetical protein ACTJKN_25900 [Pedobacter sp. 22163]|uniref:hypothetical protein n=1 Tax=Pedobacter sp. 22163 TaxID=3453883 RepID=UPI003F84A18A